MSPTHSGTRTDTDSYTSIIWGGFALFTLHALVFVYYTTAPEVRSDVWRHLDEIVIPFLEGRAGLEILWTNHHPSPLLHLLQITNLKLFGLRLDLHAYLGFFFQFLSTGLLLARILGTTHRPGRGRAWPEAVAGLLVVAILLGFNIIEQYSWPLLATVQYLYFFAVVLYLGIDRCVETESWQSRTLVAGMALFFMFANADFGSVFLASAVAVLLLVFALERRAAYLRTALLVIGAWAVYQALLWQIDPEPVHSDIDPVDALLRILAHPWPAISRYSLALGRGLIDIWTLKTKFPALEPFIVNLSPLLTAAMLGTFVTYCLRKSYRRSLIPLILMVAPAIFAASLFVYRYRFVMADPWALAPFRYVPTYKLTIVGMLWALWVMATEREVDAGKSARLLLATAAGLLLAVLLSVQAWQIYLVWDERADRTRSGNYNNALAIYLLGDTSENDFEPSPIIQGNRKPRWQYQETLEYLQRNRLNVFSPTFPPSPLLDRHVASRNAFLAAGYTVLEQAAGEPGTEEGTDGPLEWTLEKDGLTLRNTSDADYLIRAVITAKTNQPPNNSAWIESGGTERYRVRVYEGTVALYFTVNRNDRFNLRTMLPTRIDRVEVRRAATNG